MIGSVSATPPGDDLTPVADPEVDLDALLAEVRAAAAEKRRSGVYTEEFLESLAEPLDVTPDPAFAGGPRWEELETTAEIRPWAPLVSTRPLVGPLIVLLKRLVRRSLRWYLWPVTEQVSEHNRVVAAVLAAQNAELGRLRLECEQLRRRLADLERTAEEGDTPVGFATGRRAPETSG